MSPHSPASSPTPAPRPHSPLTRLALPVYVPSLIWSTGSGALAPVMVLAALSLGYSQSMASTIAGISGLVGVLTGPWVGRRITRWGDRPAFITGTVLAVVSLAVTLVALAAPGQRWGQIAYLLGIIALSVSANIWSLARQAYVAESVPVGYRARAMSMLGGMLRLGQLIGPAAGSVAIAVWGLPGSFWFQILTTVVALGFVLAFVAPPAITGVEHPPRRGAHEGGAALVEARQAGAEETALEEESALTEEEEDEEEADRRWTDAHAGPADLPGAPPREKADAAATALLSIGVVILSLVRANRAVVIPLWGHELGISDHVISATFGASAVLDTLMFYPAGRISDRFGRRSDLLPTMVVMGLGFIAMALWTTPLGFVVTACLIGFGNGFGSGIVMTMGADLSPDVGRSSFLGLWQSIGQIGSTVGPFAVAVLVSVTGVAASAWVTGVVSLVGGLWFALTVPRAYARLGIDDRGHALGA